MIERNKEYQEQSMSPIVGINVDALKTQAESLRKQLADIDTVLRIVTVTGSPAPAVSIKEKPAPVDAPQVTNYARKEPRASPQRGARKAALLALHTGASSTREIARGLVWSERMAAETLYSAKDSGLVEESAGGVWALTEKGRTHARWFIEHPQYVMYTPWREMAERPKAAV